MSGWRTSTLATECDLLAGYPFSSSQFADRPTGAYLVKGSNISHREIDWKSGPWWSGSIDTRIDRFRLLAGDVVLAMDRPIVQEELKVAWVSDNDPPCYLVQRVARIRARAGVNPRYVRFVMLGAAFHSHIASVTTGANVPHISGDDISRFAFEVPPVATQERIADILSAYDDLIENNKRRMALLEESVHLLYREWFVHLRFPGHERARVVDGLPDGWRRTTLGSVASVNSGSVDTRNPPSSIEYLDISAVGRGEILTATTMPWAEAPSRARRLVKDGDVIWSTVRPANRAYSVVFAPPENLVVSTGFATLTPVGIPTAYLYSAVTTDTFVEHMTSVATGASYPAVSASDFINSRVVVPDRSTLAAFDAIAAPQQAARATLQRQRTSLAAARDALLPKLMSGALPV